MQANVGGVERVVRIVAGIGLVLFALLSTHPLHNWGWIGVLLLATGLIGWCPPYALLGINTCKKR
jgi:Inner membrane protein YgaP-like, transmembrane domain